jgi:hypothetical protein
MLLAKLRYAVLGVATLALVSTSVGVVAQTAPDGPPATDRLKAVEQKLDRLLEVLGGSRPFTFTPAPATSPSAPAATTMPPTLPGLPAAPAPAPAIAHGFGTPTSSSSSSGTATLARGDVVGRVDRLERKLNELERRFSSLERRISSSGSRPMPQPMAPLPPGAPVPGVDLPPVPPTPPVASGPFDDLDINTTVTLPSPTSGSAPSTNTPDEATPPPDTESIPLPSPGTDAPPAPQASPGGSLDPA